MIKHIENLIKTDRISSVTFINNKQETTLMLFEEATKGRYKLKGSEARRVYKIWLDLNY